MSATLIHLDTGFLIGSTGRGFRENTELRRWMSSGLKFGVSAVAWSEFLCGPLDEESYNFAVEIVGAPEPFIAADAQVAAEFFNLSGRRKGHLADCMIAATAVRLGA